MLIEQLPPIEAGELLAATQAAAAPHTKPEDYRAFVRSLRREIRRALPVPEPPKVELIEHNPEKAAAWLEARGIRVVRAL